VVADFARDLADCAITLDAPNVQFIRTLAAHEGRAASRPRSSYNVLERFGTLAISFWPCMVPSLITIDDAAAPHASLSFMF
jgi:cytochrome bd-type quinol oxidase subunit 2